MASLLPTSAEGPDLSGIPIDNNPDSQWSIDVNILLDTGASQYKGAWITLTMHDATLGASAANDIYTRERWHSEKVAYTLVSVKDNRDLDARVTLIVGENLIPMSLPRALLIDTSEFFKAAFGMSSAFAEAISGEMRLPEEDPKEFVFLLRLLIEGLDHRADMKRLHWPHHEEEEEAWEHRHRHSFPEEQPRLFRFLAMADRLGFNAAKGPFQSLFREFSTGLAAYPLAPPFVDWVMEHGLDNGCLQRYVALWLAGLVDSRVTTLRTYEAQLLKYPAIPLLMSDARHPDGLYSYAWDQTEGVWKTASRV